MVGYGGGRVISGVFVDHKRKGFLWEGGTKSHAIFSQT